MVFVCVAMVKIPRTKSAVYGSVPPDDSTQKKIMGGRPRGGEVCMGKSEVRRVNLSMLYHIIAHSTHLSEDKFILSHIILLFSK